MMAYNYLTVKNYSSVENEFSFLEHLALLLIDLFLDSLKLAPHFRALGRGGLETALCRSVLKAPGGVNGAHQGPAPGGGG